MGVVDIYRNLDPVLNSDFVYTSLDEVPPDEMPEGVVDGDNSLLAEYPGGIPMTAIELAQQGQRNADMNLRLMLNKKIIVPLPRKLYYKPAMMRGQDVLALQRALAKAKVRKWGNFTGVFGKGTKHNIQEFQEKKGHKRDGIYDLDTHKLLAPYYDSYGTFLMHKVNKRLTASTPRQTIVAYAMFGYNNRYKIHYTQGSARMYGVRNKVRPPRIPYYEDCSSFATWLYWGAGLPDPNGFGYNGFGYTGTLSRYGVRTSNPQPGDLGFYGGYPYGHVVIYVGNNLSVSHGSEGGPYLLNPYYRSDFSHWRTYPQ